MSEAATRNRAGYDKDFAAWAEEQARLLREGDVAALDLDHLAEEIESLGNSERNALFSRSKILLQHLLKWRFQPERQSRSWFLSIKVQRRDIARLLKQSPSLRPTLPEVVTEAYPDAREDALEETGLYRLPDTCPWSVEQVMSSDFLPD